MKCLLDRFVGFSVALDSIGLSNYGGYMITTNPSTLNVSFVTNERNMIQNDKLYTLFLK